MDTTIFHLHNVSTYPILAQVALHNDESGKAIWMAAVDKNPVKTTVRKFFMDYESGNCIPVKYWDKLDIKSSNHEANFCFDASRDLMIINVSIPKFLFGNNVVDLVTPPMHRKHQAGRFSPYHHIEFWMECIRHVFDKVMLAVTKGNYLEINYMDVEIHRVDIAVNQVFPNKKDALRWLTYLEGIRKKFSRDDSNSVQYNSTGITFQTQRSYVKIYHKGNEFANVQAKHIRSQMEARRMAGVDKQESGIHFSEKNIQWLQDRADRILRYEFEFKPVMMSYIFNNRLNKRWSQTFQSMKKAYKYLQRDHLNTVFLRDNTKMYEDVHGALHKEKIPNFKFIHFFTKGTDGKEREFTDKEYIIKRLLDHQGVKKGNIKSWMKFMGGGRGSDGKSGHGGELGAVRSFRWKIDYSLPGMFDTYRRDIVRNGKKIGEHTALTETPQEIKFSYAMMVSMVAEVNKFFNQFQIEQKDSVNEFRDKISAYNDHIAVLNLSAVRKLRPLGPAAVRSLVNFHQLHEARISQRSLIKQEYSKATYHRLMKQYKLISGKNYQIAHAYFGDVERNYDMVLRNFINLLNTDNTADKFYRVAFKPAS